MLSAFLGGATLTIMINVRQKNKWVNYVNQVVMMTHASQDHVRNGPSGMRPTFAVEMDLTSLMGGHLRYVSK